MTFAIFDRREKTSLQAGIHKLKQNRTEQNRHFAVAVLAGSDTLYVACQTLRMARSLLTTLAVLAVACRSAISLEVRGHCTDTRLHRTGHALFGAPLRECNRLCRAAFCARALCMCSLLHKGESACHWNTENMRTNAGT